MTTKKSEVNKNYGIINRSNPLTFQIEYMSATIITLSVVRFYFDLSTRKSTTVMIKHWYKMLICGWL